MGRNRKSAERRAAQGNPGKRNLDRDQDAPALEAPPAVTEPDQASPVPADDDAPAELDGFGLAIWRTYVADIARLSFVRNFDRPLLMRYCEHMAVWWRATVELRASNITYETNSNHGKMVRIHPLSIARDRIEARLIDIEDRLGLNPKARQKIMSQLAGMGANHPGADLAGQDCRWGRVPRIHHPHRLSQGRGQQPVRARARRAYAITASQRAVGSAAVHRLTITRV